MAPRVMVNIKLDVSPHKQNRIAQKWEKIEQYTKGKEVKSGPVP